MTNKINVNGYLGKPFRDSNIYMASGSMLSMLCWQSSGHGWKWGRWV